MVCPFSGVWRRRETMIKGRGRTHPRKRAPKRRRPNADDGMTDDSERVSRILRESPPGDRRALDRVFSLVYDELRRLAHAQLARGPAGDTISTTVLIHEAWMRLADQTGARFPDRVHFMPTRRA